MNTFAHILKYVVVGAILWYVFFGKKERKMERKIKNKSIFSDVYRFAANSGVNQIFSKFQTSLGGLHEDSVEEARKKYGENIITQKKQDSLFKQIIKAFITPFTGVLMALAAITFFTDFIYAEPGEKDLTGCAIIVVMVILSGAITLFQTVKSNNAAEKLKDMVKVTATVTRSGNDKFELPMEEIVCGDIVHLSAGDMIPADVRLVNSKDLFVRQSAMTGESDAVEKMADPVGQVAESVTDYQNIVFMGSNVVSGAATGVVIAVGDSTFLGNIAVDVSKDKKDTSFELGISSVSWLLIKFMMIMAPVCFVINGITKGDWMEAFLFALSIAVGLTPEMLPMIVNTSLVKGATHMSKEGTIIKNVNSIQNFGAIDVLCTDKTGTLTQDKIVLQYHLDVNGKEDNRVLRHAFFNSFYQTGLKNLMDIAIIEATEKELNMDTSDYEKVDEIPFDFQRRRMSVVIKDEKGKTQVITKGAVEEMLSISSFVEYEGQVVPLTEELKATILKTVDELNEDGLRVIAVAQKSNPRKVGEFSIKDESEMVLIGYLAFLDPPKDSTKAALKALAEHDVDVKVLTGDNALVTKAVCGQVGIDASEIILGHEIENMTDTMLINVVEKHNVFAKLSPNQKTRVVKALRDNGHTVGFMGDGINDAPAMKEADVGISVDTAVDIAKESADVILLQKDLMILEKGIVQGRHTFGNIIKYIYMTLSSNFGNMFSVLAASLFLPFLPMLPIQLLFLNLIYDISCISMPWDNVDHEYLEKPRKWDISGMRSFTLWLGPTSSIFDITTYLMMYFIVCPAIMGGSFHSLDATGQAMFIAIFHAGWFIESLWTQTLVIHALRTPKLPFIKSRASLIVTLITGSGIAVGTILPYTALGANLGLLPLSSLYFVVLIGTVFCYLMLVQFIKNLYIRRFGELY